MGFKMSDVEKELKKALLESKISNYSALIVQTIMTTLGVLLFWRGFISELVLYVFVFVSLFFALFIYARNRCRFKKLIKEKRKEATEDV